MAAAASLPKPGIHMASRETQQDMAELQSAIAPMAYSSSAQDPPIHPDTHAADNDADHAADDDDDNDNEESKIPLDIVRLTLLMVSGKRHTYDFHPSATILDVKKHVLEGWPQEWGSDPARSGDPQHIELLYLGKFLTNHSTLESNRLHGGDSFTVHLLIRERPHPKSPEGTKDAESSPRCKCCVIL